MKKVDFSYCRSCFDESMDTCDKLIASAKNEASLMTDIYGFSFVLMFAAYEHLLKSIARELNETALTFRGKASKLKAPFAAIAIKHSFDSFLAMGQETRWIKGAPGIIDELRSQFDNKGGNFFPNTGTYMDKKQLKDFCEFYRIGDPGQILGPAYGILEDIRSKRNSISHGEYTPKQAALGLSEADMMHKAKVWREGWLRFIDEVERLSSVSSFFHL